MEAIHTVAQSASLGDAVLWLGILVGLVFLGGTVIYAIRRRMRSSEVESGQDLDLDTFRRLLAAGEITPQEFEAARAAIVARHGGVGSDRTVSPIDPRRVRARPGVDLTGDPLPRPIDGGRDERRARPDQGPEN